MRMIKLTVILFLFANIFSYGQEFDFFSNGQYSNDPVVDSGLVILLTDLKEPIINEPDICDDCEIYRFTWLRTFHNPIIVRLERKSDRYKLTYKIGNGSAGYEPKGLKKSKTITISKRDYDYFSKMLNQTEFDTIPNRYFFPVTDGAFWILEHRTGFDYKGHATNDPKEDFEVCFLYLLELANIDYDKEDFHVSYINQRIYLNKKNEIIKEEILKDTILFYLNDYIAENKLHNDWCYYDDLIFSVKPSGKITKIIPPREENWIEDKIWQFESRKCWKAYKKELRRLDLSYLDLKNRIRINMELYYDKETNKLRLTD